jgi:hypothetical protein
VIFSRKLWILFSLWCFILSDVQAQGIPIGVVSGGASSPRTASDSLAIETEEDDTANIRYYFVDNPALTFPEKDSLLGNYLHQYDPARKRTLDYFNLGVAGSAAYPSVYAAQPRSGFDFGLHAYDIYMFKPENLAFYEQTKPFSDLYYSGNQQTNGFIRTRFGSNFANGLSLSVDFQRIYNLSLPNSPVVQNRFYSDFPKTRATAFTVGMRYQQARYTAFCIFNAGIVTAFDRGGLVSDALFRQPQIGNLTSDLDVFLTDANTRHERFELSYLQKFELLKPLKRDSTVRKRQFLATHKLNLRREEFLFVDIFAQNQPRLLDTLFYRNLLTDTRGMRFYMRARGIENQFSLNTNRSRADTTMPNGVRTDLLEFGIKHSYLLVNQEIRNRNINNVSMNGQWSLAPNRRLSVGTQAQFYVLGYNAGDYQISGNLELTLAKIGSLRLSVLNQLYEPNFLQDNLVLTQRPIWQNDFKKTLETQFTAVIAVPRLGFEGSIRSVLLNNFIYFDNMALPKQSPLPLSVGQFWISQTFKWRAFNNENVVGAQAFSEKLLNLPTFFLKSSVFLEGKIFKKVMRARIGTDIRLNSQFSPSSYMPATGQFYLQNDAQMPFSPIFDAFLSFKVRSFRFFVKYENLVGDLSRRVYYPTYNYPMLERQFRFGLRWQLLN